jgi:four helix bundle protein
VTITGYKDLRVWRLGIDLVERVYRASRDFPRHELYSLTSQMRRAAVSAPANIAEGHTREHTKEYLNFISIAQASIAELQTEIEIASRLGYLARNEADSLAEETINLARQLYALRNALARKR